MFPFPRKQQLLLKRLAFSLFFILGSWLVLNTITIISVSSKPADAFFVLGGSISREIYVAELAKQYPQIPILISHGSPDACIVQIFRQLAPEQFQNVWLEKCADSTFENFYYGIPILRSWGVHKVKLITSNTHVPRAKWMAQILLGSHGIWVEPEIVPEEGIPGNHESWLKTGLDVTRSLLWAGLSQIIQPQCSEVTRLTQVNLLTWQYQGFKCESQNKIPILDSKGKYTGNLRE